MMPSTHVDTLESRLADAQAEGLEANLRRAIDFVAAGWPLELQAIGVQRHSNDVYAMAWAAHAQDADEAVKLCAESERMIAQGVYLLPAAIKTGVETRHHTPGSWYAVPKRGGTTDSDVESRCIFGVDLDVVRPGAISATDLQMRTSVAAAVRTYAYLANVVGESSLAFVHSGNGRQLWVALDRVRADDTSRLLVASVLAGLGSMFSTDTVKVDLKLSDAKRILPACGTTKKKGASGVADRPHRRTAIVAPTDPRRLSLEELVALAERIRDDAPDAGKAAMDAAAGIRNRPVAPARPRFTSSPFDAGNALDPVSVAEWLDLYDAGDLRCPGCGESQGVDVIDHGLKCLHNRCNDKGKNGFRTNVDLVMEVRGVDKFEAVRQLGEHFGFSVPAAKEPSTGIRAHVKTPSVPPPANVNDWGEPDHFGATKLPPFPVDALPTWLRNWCAIETSVCQVPLDLPCVLALATASLACARLYHLQVRPDWAEPLNLWVAAALLPGERKSAVYGHAVAPVHRFAEKITTAMAQRIRQRDLDRKILAGRLEAATAAAIKGKLFESTNAAVAAADLAMQLDNLPPVVPPSFLADDVTPEALAVVLSQNHERIGLFSAEGGPFDMMAGRYSDSGSKLELYLKAHAGDAHIVNRIKREPLHLKQPLVTMAITLQPSVIAGLQKKEGFRGRGLLARVLFSMPQSRVGGRETDPTSMPPEVSKRYAEAMFALLQGDPSTPIALTMSEGADARRSAFQSALEPRLGPDGDLRAMVDWASKLTGAVCRIAGVLHLAEHAESSRLGTLEVQAETFANAEAIGLYFLAHARRAFDVMGSDDASNLAQKVWDWAQRKGLSEFSERDARRACHSTSEEIEPALHTLSARNLIRKKAVETAHAGRPAGPRFEVSPVLPVNETSRT